MPPIPQSSKGTSPADFTTDVVELAARLIRIDSTSGTDGEREVLVAAARWLETRGVPAVTITETSAGPCLLARSTSHSSGGTLLAAHADTVPVPDSAAWTHDPFAAEVADGYLYGRGASDMKGGLAAACGALVRLAALNVPSSLLITVGEEIGCVGAYGAIEHVRRLKPQAVIIPEATGGHVRLGHRGAVWLDVVAGGIAAHGAQPNAGRNAIVAMSAALMRLDQAPLLSHEVLGDETINVGMIHGGVKPNMVAHRCTAKFDVRVVDQGAEHIMQWLKLMPDIISVTASLNLPAVWTRADHPWLRTLANLGLSCGGAVPYFTDASVLGYALDDDVPVVIWGPGRVDCVHKADECIAVHDIEVCVDKYVAAVLQAI